MKTNENLEKLFSDLNGQFDIHELKDGHQARFLNRLQNKTKSVSALDKSKHWTKYLSIAAMLILCLSIFMIIPQNQETMDLASVSPELSETQDFFTVTLEAELKKLNNERSPFTEKIINDALVQIEILEQDYQNLKTDLTESGKDQRVIYAMISNFQSRIEILSTVLEQIETINEFKSNTNETTNTI